jgi:hypothetical protein
MDDELVGKSESSNGESGTHPASPVPADWNSSLAVPSPDARQPRESSVAATTDSTMAEAPSPIGRRPPWRDPWELPGVQRAHTGAFGEKLRAIDEARHVLLATLDSIDTVGLTDPEAVALIQAVEAIGRPVDAARVSTAAVIGDRARNGLGHDSLAWRMGAASPSELLTRLTNASAWEMNRRVKLGGKVAPRSEGGVRLDPVFPVVAAALVAGELGVEAAGNIVGALADYKPRGRFDADPAVVDAAEAALVESATGSVFGRSGAESDGTEEEAADGGPICRLGDSAGSTFPADLVKSMAPEWLAIINPDGIAPNDATSEAKSTFGFGKLQDGLFPLRGGFTPALKGIVSNVFNTFLSARSRPAFPSAEEQARIDSGELVPGDALDDRTGGQKRAEDRTAAERWLPPTCRLQPRGGSAARCPSAPGAHPAPPEVPRADGRGAAWYPSDRRRAFPARAPRRRRRRGEHAARGPAAPTPSGAGARCPPRSAAAGATRQSVHAPSLEAGPGREFRQRRGSLRVRADRPRGTR